MQERELDSLDHALLDAVTHAFTLNDIEIESLEKAAQDTANAIENAPEQIVSYALVAIDSNIAQDSPVLEAVKASVLLHWKSLNSVHRNQPTALLRFVLLRALRLLDNVHASPIYLTCCDPLHRSNNESERAILIQWLSEFQRLHTLSVKNQLNFAETKKVTSNTKIPTIGTKEFQEDLQTGLEAAFSNGNHIANNPSYGASTVYPQWATAASSQAATTINDTLTTLTKHISAHLEKIVIPIVNPDALTTGNKIVIQRMNLMWWLQAHYSNRLQRRYRSLDPWVAAVAMASDLNEIAPDPVSTTIEALLEEAMFGTFGDAAEQQKPLLEALKSISGADLGEMGSAPSNQHRMLLTNFIRSLRVSGKAPTEKQTSAFIGVSGKHLLSPSALGVWYLRALSAEGVL